MKSVGKKYTGIVECKVGNFIQHGVGLTGMPKLRQLSPEEIAEIDATNSEPCDCIICIKRRKFAVEVTQATGLRSGKKRGWEKYGPGRTL
jgi:hypothetical protein